MSDRKTVALLLFDGVDLLDVGGPYEVLLTANRLSVRAGHQELFDVVTVSLGGAACIAYGGLKLEPASAVEAIAADILIVPGLVDVPAALSDVELLGAIGSMASSVEIVASVCTGALLLAKAGLLGETTATTHFEDVDQLGEMIGRDNAVTARWVDAGSVITAGGLSNGIAMALHLVHRLHSLELAQKTARQIEYPWHPNDGESVRSEG